MSIYIYIYIYIYVCILVRKVKMILLRLDISWYCKTAKAVSLLMKTMFSSPFLAYKLKSL